MVRPSFPVITPETVARYDVPGPRYTSYPTVPTWGPMESEVLGEKLERAALEGPGSPLSMYVHIPFCRERCTFCGCNVVVTKERPRADEYLDALEKEIDLFAARLGERRALGQLHWGGGTPTFLELDQLERLFGMITRRFTLLADAEVAVEIDPMETSGDQLRLLRQLGFNRLSMGVQDFEPSVQEVIRRVQGVDVTQGLLQLGRELGFEGVNFDLIYGLPNQAPEGWARTLETVLSLSPDRLAVYSFAFVPDARPHQRRLGLLPRAQGADKLELFRMAYDAFLGAGYLPIGMDHFAKPGDELARASRERVLGRNFQGYTVKAASDVIAVGVSAISDVQSTYAQNVQALAKYYAAIAEGRFPTERGKVLDLEDRKRQRIINSIMCNFWVDLGPTGERDYAPELARLARLEAEGLVRRSGSELEVTPIGRVFVRNVAMVFDHYLSAQAQESFSRTV